MKAKEIRDLIDFISQSGLDEVSIETEEFKLSVKKNCGAKTESPLPKGGSSNEKPQVKLESPTQFHEPEAAITIQENTVNNNYITIKSPMIGTFYQSANPESDPFIKVGDTVTTGQTVCIIEAMKLFNEIESEISGKVLKILVDNATPVEFDQPLFLVDPS